MQTQGDSAARALAVDRCRPEGSVGDESCAWYTNVEDEESESEDEDAEDEDATVAIPPAAVAAAVSVAPGTPAATTPTATRQDSATKLLTPMELASMASGAKGVEPTAEKPAEEPAPVKAKAKAKARPKQAPPPPQGPPPQGPPPPRGLRLTDTALRRLRRDTSRRAWRDFASKSTMTSPDSSRRNRRRFARSARRVKRRSANARSSS